MDGQARARVCLRTATIVMNAPRSEREALRLKILLIGNYLPDAQESMRRYAELMLAGLLDAGHQVQLAQPRPFLNETRRPGNGLWKWIGYVDKYLLSPRELRRAASSADVVHICDHSNSVYVPPRSPVPYVVTCHDLLAVRGALGEQTDCPASFAGRRLQRWILRSLHRAAALACVSGATMRDARRLLLDYRGKMVMAPNALNHSYRVLDPLTLRRRLAGLRGIGEPGSYVLNVGSNLRRKNREAAINALSRIASRWHGKIVFAGQGLTPDMRDLAMRLGVADRVVEVAGPSNELLEALYNGALALLFPSRFEGFGWPIIEAQACDCPVICSDCEPLPEVAGNAAIRCHSEDHQAFAEAILTLANQVEVRDNLKRLGRRNSERYDRSAMIASFVALYQQLKVAA
jgi:glycosyltransferase involved in cell wall biosynthesis